MGYKIYYYCVSNTGRVREMNQDNFVCDGQYMEINDSGIEFPLSGVKSPADSAVFGVFDGMGGEECGEVAAYIAAKDAAEIIIKKNAVRELASYCQKANSDICGYAKAHDIASMGTTAAMLVFTDREIVLCNIGDSRIFRLCGGILEQISMDHVGIAEYGTKPPLLQCLGIPPSELIIDPYFARGAYKKGDIYMICSDGLTDMLNADEITEILDAHPVEEAITKLLDKALEKGGKDNITIILFKIEKQTRWHLKFWA